LQFATHFATDAASRRQLGYREAVIVWRAAELAGTASEATVATGVNGPAPGASKSPRIERARVATLGTSPAASRSHVRDVHPSGARDRRSAHRAAAAKAAFADREL